jgi:hypothetical protein
VVRDTLLGAVATKLVQPGDEIVSIYHRRLEHGYPTPSLGRDAVLKEALPWLRKSNIWSRGRFGAYKYEVANQDHSLMLGVECVDNILFGTEVGACSLVSPLRSFLDLRAHAHWLAPFTHPLATATTPHGFLARSDADPPQPGCAAPAPGSPLLMPASRPNYSRPSCRS